MLSAAALLSLSAGCFHTPIVSRPPPPPAWCAAPCLPWPHLEGEGRVPLDELADVIAEARWRHADCSARFECLQDYIGRVVRPRE